MAAFAESTRPLRTPSPARAVITAAEIDAVPTIPLRLLPLPGTERFLQTVIAVDRVRYVGEPVAVVLADSAALAEDGVGAILSSRRKATLFRVILWRCWATSSMELLGPKMICSGRNGWLGYMASSLITMPAQKPFVRTADPIPSLPRQVESASCDH